MKPIGVGFLGAGPVTQAIHLPAIATLGGKFTLVHVMDVNLDVACRVAEPYGGIATTDTASVLDNPDVEVVAICSPNAFHADQLIAACRAGKKAVLCEKPLAISMDEAQAIRAVAAETNTPIFVGTMHAYDPAYRAAHAAWQASGDVPLLVRNAIYLPPNEVYTDQATEVVSAPAATSSAPPPTPDNGQAAMRAAMLGLAIHNLPLVRDFTPDVSRLLSAKFLSPFGYALLAEAGGSTVELTGFIPGSWPHRWTFEVVGRTHRLHADMPPSYVMSGSAVVHLEGPTETSTFHLSSNGYQALWDTIADTVLNGALPPISLDTAIGDLSLALQLADDIDAMLEGESK